MAKARRRADRTPTPAVHRGKHIDGKKHGSRNWVASQLRNKSFCMITDFLTMLMASGLFGVCFMCWQCCCDPSTDAARYGFPPSQTAIALAITLKDGALSTVALAILYVLEYRGQKGKEDSGIRIFSLTLLAIIAVRWGMVIPGCSFDAMSLMLNGSTNDNSGYVSVSMIIAAMWWMQTRHEHRSVVTASVFELAKMELQRLAYLCKEEEVLSRKQRSRIARIEYEAKKALELKQKSEKATKTSKTPADAIEPRSVAELATEVWREVWQVEYDSDSGYSNSGDEAQGVAAKLASIGEEDAEHNLCSDCCVCLEEGAATRAIMPCRHLCLCADCENIGLELCPICREEIADIVQVADGDEDDYF